MRVKTLIAVLIAALGTGYMFAAGGDSSTEVSSGIFTEEQAESGVMFYRQSCAECHGIRLGGGMGPALDDEAFLRAWGERSVAALDAYVRAEMPLGLGGTLSEEAYSEIMAFILQSLGHEAGTVQYSVDLSQLEDVMVDPLLN